MRLAEPATESNFEYLKPPYVGVAVDLVIRFFFILAMKCAKLLQTATASATSTTYKLTHHNSFGSLGSFRSSLIKNAPRFARRSWIRAPMTTYFGNVRSVVSPPEWLQILWLVNPHNCRFSVARELSCLVNTPEGQFMTNSVGTCHHMSYVRTTTELVHMKFASFEHSDEVLDDWLENVWEAWKIAPNSTVDLHPTHPEAYKLTVQIQLLNMPPVLRQQYEHCYDLPALERSEGLDVVEMICGGGSGFNVEFDVDLELELDLIAKKIDEEELEVEVSPLPLKYYDLETSHPNELGDGRSFKSIINVTDISKDLVTELDPTNPSPLDCANPKFLVLTVMEGEKDLSTEQVFHDIGDRAKRASFEEDESTNHY